MNYFLKPQNNISRYIDTLLIFIAGIASISFYFVINFNFCLNEVCESLTISKIWVAQSFIYLIYGVSLIIVSIFIYRKNQLLKIYSLGITLLSLSSFVLIGMQIVAIQKELNAIT